MEETSGDGWWDDPQWRESVVELDDEALKGLAHPLRVELLALLRAEGPSTSTRLAQRAGTDTGTTSYHLRQLERYGLVADVPGRGSRRERWWRARHRQTTWSSARRSDDREVQAAEDVVLERQLQHEVELVRRWLAVQGGWPGPWRAASASSDWLLRLGPEQAAALSRELSAVVERHRDAAEQAPEPGTEAVAVIVRLLPQVPGGPG